LLLIFAILAQIGLQFLFPTGIQAGKNRR